MSVGHVSRVGLRVYGLNVEVHETPAEAVYTSVASVYSRSSISLSRIRILTPMTLCQHQSTAGQAWLPESDRLSYDTLHDP